MKLLKGLKVFSSGLILLVVIMGTFGLSIYLNPYLLFIYIPLVYYLLYKRSVIKVNIFREFYKDSRSLLREFYKDIRSLVPKNKITRLVLNIGFVVVWYCVWGFIIDASIPKYPNGDTRGYSQGQELILTSCVFVPILFITLLFWFKNTLNIFRKIKDIPNTLSKAKKETKKRLKSTAKYLSKSNFSDADELKKYADLRDQGIITEEEFKAKKKQLLDL